MRSQLVGAACLLLAAMAGPALWAQAPPSTAARPNVLWVTSEDNGPQLGCYGDEYATTPHIDALARRGVVYEHCWSNAPVCAPARTTIISGMYPPSLGAEHMRSMTGLPEAAWMFPQYLRKAGYYCTNNSKEDYNLTKGPEVWDESSRKAHWRNRKPGQPFFAVFNFTVSHESQIRKRPHQAVHDPATVHVPAYHPDTPEVRQDWAQYYDKITEMDAQVGQVLKQLAADGLDKDTIIFYYGDHGSGMPRSKRWPYNSGLHVPLVVHIPEKFKDLAPIDYVAGGTSDRLVSFVDLAPTVLSLCGLEVPRHMQGHAFLGPKTSRPQSYLYGFRGRMDERYDLVRCATDGRFVYIRNFMPHRIYGQYIQYMFQTPTTRVWREMFDRSELNEAQAAFWQKKAPEELYDLENDPDEVRNLANDPLHQATVEELRQAVRQWQLDIRDVGILPEDEIHRRSGSEAPYTMARDPQRYHCQSVLDAAEVCSRPLQGDIEKIRALLRDDDSAVRYWGATGMLIRGESAVRIAGDELKKALSDESGSVRVVAAHALAQYGEDADVQQAVPVLLENADQNAQGLYVAMLALNALDDLDRKVAPWSDKLKALPRKTESGRLKAYVGNLLDKIQADL